MNGNGSEKNACPAPGCKRMKPWNKAFCYEHWKKVPIALANDIWKHYRAKDWTAWSTVMEQAKTVIAQKESGSGYVSRSGRPV